MLHIYAHPASQPSRAVMWFCAINDIPCQLTCNPETDLSGINPRQQMPFLMDDGFALNEMPAMLAYLADKLALHSWYPAELQPRSRIQSYLHSHHSLTRLATLKLMAPHVLAVFDEPPFGPATSTLSNETIQAAMADPDKLANGRQLMRAVVGVFEEFYLSEGAYIGGLPAPSIADLAAYEELAQLTWANLMDLDGFEKTSAWLTRMSSLPHHEALHRYNLTLGDIVQPPSAERFAEAISAGLAGLADAGLTPQG